MERSRRGLTKDVEGKICIITGANTGIGYQAALQLAQLGAHVILACRSPERGNEAVESIKKELQEKQKKVSLSEIKNVEFMALDLGSLKSIQNFAANFINSGRPLYALILNAGVMPMLPAKRGETVDGFEQCFGINYLGHFLLTLLLLGPLKEDVPSRVIALSSTTHCLGSINLEDLDLKEGYTHDRAYCQSKFMDVILAMEITRRYSHLGIYANSLCPGIVASDIIRDAPWIIRVPARLLMRGIGKSTAQGAETIVYAATSEELEEVGGKYLEDSAISEAHPKAYDEFIGAQLWEESIKRLSAHGIDLSEAELYARVSKPSENKHSKIVPRGWVWYNWRIYHKVYITVAAFILGIFFIFYLLWSLF